MESESKCPALGGPHRHTAVGTMSNQHWWPNQLNLKILHQNSPLSDPMGKDFNYAEEFKTVDLDALKNDINELMTTHRVPVPPTMMIAGAADQQFQGFIAGIQFHRTDGRGGVAPGVIEVGPNVRTA